MTLAKNLVIALVTIYVTHDTNGDKTVNLNLSNDFQEYGGTWNI